MLMNTFQHLPGIGAQKERALWDSGVVSLTQLAELQRVSQLALFSALPGFRNSLVDQSLSALAARDVSFFSRSLHPSEYFRIALEYPDQTVFLDIETTGLSLYYDKVTVVGTSLNGTTNFWAPGLSTDSLFRSLRRAKAIVTFNGTLFDIPFLKKDLPSIPLPEVHVDLRYLCRRVGLTGGLKIIEETLAANRPPEIAELNGEAAPLLWNRFQRGDSLAGENLLAYNFHDIESLKSIFEIAVERYLSLIKFPEQYKLSLSQIFRRTRLRPSALRAVIARIPLAGPHHKILDLLPSPDIPNMRVVGIDLTGSEKRPTGWCLLSGLSATTALISKDADIVRTTLQSKPHLVSIDSPLALPKGRQTVYDDDPARKAFGITRECERILFKRGVRVYPCLIRSMQQLTERGIRLAEEFRKAGVPVIESFPGAAQDILGIPRKRASIELLKQGLQEIGISGSFSNTHVSHDELDAITSALVSYFFWSGSFEALGNSVEGYLIVPSVQPTPRESNSIIGLSGYIGAGKTTAARFLEEKGYGYARFSSVLAQLLVEQGLPVTRSNLQSIGSAIHQDPGQRWLCARLLATIADRRNIVIDGIRWPEDFSYFTEQFGPHFRHIFIETAKRLRVERTRQEGNYLLVEGHPVEKSIPKVKALAHEVVTNNSSVRQFLRKIGELL